MSVFTNITTKSASYTDELYDIARGYWCDNAVWCNPNWWCNNIEGFTDFTCPVTTYIDETSLTSNYTDIDSAATTFTKITGS